MSLVIKNLTKRFDSKQLFSDFSYSFQDTGIYALVGESGIGKTTLLRMIGGLDTDYSGEIIFDGKRRVSMAFQEHRLFPTLSALDNVVLAISNGKDKAVYEKSRKMLVALGFSETDMNLTPDALSGGMRQRVSVARALLYKADILLLDEPTKELDEENRGRLLSLIKSEGEIRLVIIVSHDQNDLDRLGATGIMI